MATFDLQKRGKTCKGEREEEKPVPAPSGAISSWIPMEFEFKTKSETAIDI